MISPERLQRMFCLRILPLYLERVPAISGKAEATGPRTIIASWTPIKPSDTTLHMYGYNYEVTKKDVPGIVRSGSLPLSASSLTVSGLEPSTEYHIDIITVGLYSRQATQLKATTSVGGKRITGID